MAELEEDEEDIDDEVGYKNGQGNSTGSDVEKQRSAEHQNSGSVNNSASTSTGLGVADPREVRNRDSFRSESPILEQVVVQQQV